MNKSEFKDFSLIWRSSIDLTGGKITEQAIALAFTVLSRYGLQEIKGALSAHLSDSEKGRFQPKPADVIYQIEKQFENDGRPDANEAWSIAINSFNESATVVLNDEIALSLEYARDIYLDGDKTGARMAFKESYDKNVTAARQEKKPVNWWPSLGHDKHGRESVLRDAVIKGWLKSDHVNGLLPAPVNIPNQLQKLIKENPIKTIEIKSN